MKKFLRFFLAFSAGALCTLLLLGAIAAVAWDYFAPFKGRYNLVAVSWGKHTSGTQMIYQVQVSASDGNFDGDLDVVARICIGGDMYAQELGKIGSVKNMEEALRDYGQIIWLPDRVTIGGAAGEKASVPRSVLQSHR